MAKDRESKAGQSRIKWKMSCDFEPQLLHKELLARPILLIRKQEGCCARCRVNEKVHHERRGGE